MIKQMKVYTEYSGDEYITSPVLGNHHSGLRKSFLKDYLITTIVLFDSNSFPSFPPTLTERSWPVVTILAKGETRSNQIQSFSALRFSRLTGQDQPVKATPAGRLVALSTGVSALGQTKSNQLIRLISMAITNDFHNTGFVISI